MYQYIIVVKKLNFEKLLFKICNGIFDINWSAISQTKKENSKEFSSI